MDDGWLRLITYLIRLDRLVHSNHLASSQLHRFVSEIHQSHRDLFPGTNLAESSSNSYFVTGHP